MDALSSLGHLCWQLSRISLFIVLGLFVATMIETFNWSHRLAALARPLIRLGNLSTVTGASFSLAFFSGVSANIMLAEAYDKKRMSHKELVLANLFKSLPRFFLHLPTVFFLTAPFLHRGAFLYVGLTFGVAVLQTFTVVVAGRLLLPKNPRKPAEGTGHRRLSFREAYRKSMTRLKAKLVQIGRVMVPIYLLFFVLAQTGFFDRLNALFADHLWFLRWLRPEAIGIVVLHLTAEFSAGLAAASALLADNSLGIKEVVLALLTGNILATPIRAMRHQFPYYTGIYPVKLALELIAISQLTRAGCILLVTVLYFFFG